MPEVSAEIAEALVDCLKIELGDALTDEVWESESRSSAACCSVISVHHESFSIHFREAQNFSVFSGARLVWDSWPSSAGLEGHLVRIRCVKSAGKL